MTNTSIPVDKEVQEQLNQIKDNDETWNGVMKRLMENYNSDGQRWTRREIEDIVDERIERLTR